MSAKYFVLADDGKEFGPADAMELARWAKEGRVKPSTRLRQEDQDHVMLASGVPGLFSSMASNSPLESDGLVELCVAGVLALISFTACLFFPLSGVAVYLAKRAEQKGHPAGRPAVIAAWIVVGIELLIVVGFLLLGLVLGSAFRLASPVF